MRKVSSLKIFRNLCTKVPPGWPLQDFQSPHPLIHDQYQSPLFSRLSTELRILIYEYILRNLSSFTHIFRDIGGRRRLAHKRCIDSDSPYPTWQHKCLGQWDEYPVLYVRRETVTEDGMIELLLVCRRVYAEALKILYTQNLFHFKGAKSVLAMKSKITTVQWSAIRHFHISTVFQADVLAKRRPRDYLPDTINAWRKCCEALHKLTNLRILRLDIIVRNSFLWRGWRPFADVAWLAVLFPLKNVKAEMFEIELNIAIPERVLDKVGSVNFRTIVRDRPYNNFVFH